MQSSKFELVINAQTARMLGLTVPPHAARPRRRGDRMSDGASSSRCSAARRRGWPLAARAQQPAMPVIGFLNAVSPDALRDRLRAFRQGLKEAGYVEGENVAIEYRWAENQLDRLPALAAELVRRQVAVIVAAAAPLRRSPPRRRPRRSPSSSASPKTRSGLGLVTSLARPGGNLTGINFFVAELVAKRLELLRELVPAAARVAVLVNPANPANAESYAERRGIGGSRHGAANPAPQRQHQPRDRCGLRSACARAARRSLRRPRPLLHQPARPTGHSGGAPCDSRDLFRARHVAEPAG